MNQKLHDRLNDIPGILLSKDFLEKKGLGGDLSFWIFDYPPEDELQVRDYFVFLLNMLDKKHSHLHARLRGRSHRINQRSYTH